MSSTTTLVPRPVVVVPTYQNGGTVGEIARRVLESGWACIVVDDGSTDNTQQALSKLQIDHPDAQLYLEKHAANQGKAAALKTGFERAKKLGYTHAITLDADGQHDPEQIGVLWDASIMHPEHLILGERAEQVEGGTPWRSTLGRRVSNQLIHWQSGLRVGDSQTGFRVYPLKTVETLGCTFSRFAFETEVLIRAGRTGINVLMVNIQSRYLPKAERVSHFKPLSDSLHSLAMHASILKGHPGLTRCAGGWLKHQFLYLPLFVFLIVGFSRVELEPEPRWHPAFLTGSVVCLVVIALWRRLHLGYQPLAAASILFLLLGSLGVLSKGTSLYPLIHNSYGQLQELALHLWVAVVCVLLALFRPGWLLGVSRLPETSNRFKPWVIAALAIAAVFLGILLKPTGVALAGMVPFVMVLIIQSTLQHQTQAQVNNPTSTNPAEMT